METIAATDGTLVTLRGRLDATGTATAREALHAAIDRGRGALVVDLSGVECLDATGLGVLVGSHRRAQRADRWLVLRDVPARLARILCVTRLNRIIPVHRADGSVSPVPASAA